MGEAISIDRKESQASAQQLSHRDTIQGAFGQYADSLMPRSDLLMNLGMFINAPNLAKILVLADVYERVKHLPGAFIEFGVWWGQNQVVLENLRAIYEPFYKERRIIGFDTFEGYRGFSEEDKSESGSGFLTEDAYALPVQRYDETLNGLLNAHRGANVLGDRTSPSALIRGDVRETVPAYFAENPEIIVAFAYFDLGLYEPTKIALDAILPRMPAESVLLFDELTWPDAPGEARAFLERLHGQRRYKIEKSRFFPSKSLVTLLD